MPVWAAFFEYGTDNIDLGYYETEAMAAQAHDAGLFEHVLAIDPMELKNVAFNFYSFRHITSAPEAHIKIAKPRQYTLPSRSATPPVTNVSSNFHATQTSQAAYVAPSSSSASLVTSLSQIPPQTITQTFNVKTAVKSFASDVEKTSQYKGVSIHSKNPPENPWVAQFKRNRKTIFLGLYKCQEDAARAYDAGLFQTLYKECPDKINNTKFNFPDEVNAPGFIDTIDATLDKRARPGGPKPPRKKAAAAKEVAREAGQTEDQLTNLDSDIYNKMEAELAEALWPIDDVDADVSTEIGKFMDSRLPPLIAAETPAPSPLIFRSTQVTPVGEQPSNATIVPPTKKHRLAPG